MIKNHAFIDTCIAKSVGDPVSELFWDAKKVVDEIGAGPTGLAMTDDLLVEWRKHWSNYMRKWYVKMVSRKRVRHERDRRVSDYRKAVERISSVGDKTALKKDSHLVEAAIIYQLAVLSTDDKQRRLLRQLAGQYTLVAKVQWINPNVQCRGCLIWLKQGATDREFGLVGGVDV